MDVQMPVMAGGGGPLATVVADLPVSCNRMPPGGLTTSRSGSPAATPTAISSASPATGTVAHWAEFVRLHPASVPELRLRHTASIIVTHAFRSGQPRLGCVPNARPHTALGNGSRPPSATTHNHKNRCEERLNPPGL
jgi:hypothetical protein